MIIPENNPTLVDLHVCTLWMEDDVLHVKGKQGNRQTLEDAVLVMGKIEEHFYKGQGLPMLLDMTGYKYVDRSAREYYSSDKFVPILAGVAFMTTSGMTKLLANMFLGFNKPSFPMKLFTDEKEGKRWLEQFKAKA